MAVNPFINSVRSFLASNHMFVDDDWLAGCVEYITEDSSINISERELQNLAKEQWLLNDLKDICPGSLPANLKDVIKTVLNGRFVLQINAAMDIGTPAYQQYLKLQKINTENIEATTKFDDKIPSHRMIKLYMTDGIQEVSGIEYKPMRNLTCDITPGCKILIKGPVDCRRGVMLLTEGCIELLGGEVQDIASSHSLPGLLASKLGVTITTESVLNTTQNHRNNDIPVPHSVIASVDPNSEPDPYSRPYSDQSTRLITDEFTSQSFTSRSINNRSPNANRPIDQGRTIVDSNGTVLDSNRTVLDNNRTTDAYNKPIVDYNRPIMDHNRITMDNTRPIARVTSVQVANFTDDDIDIDQLAEIEAQMHNPSLPSTSKRCLPESTPKANKKTKINIDTNVTSIDDYPQDGDIFLEDEEYLRDFEDKFDAKEIIKCRTVASEPYVFIKLINDMPASRKAGKVFRVKAQIMKLLSKLSVNKDGWSLKCTLIDGTGSIDVEFTSNVLSKLVGFTPQEMNNIKKQMANNPAIKETAVAALQKARETLQVLYCIAELTILEVPKITCLIPFENSHAESLKNRLLKSGL